MYLFLLYRHNLFTKIHNSEIKTQKRVISLKYILILVAN